MNNSSIDKDEEDSMTFKVYPNDDPDTAAKKIHEDWKNAGWFSIPKNKNESRANEKEKEKKRVKEVTLTTYKYSKRGKGELYESVMLGGIPTFLRYDEKNDKLVPHQQIDEEYRTLRPPRLEEYPYTPYEFSGIEELDECLEYAKKQSIDSLYRIGTGYCQTIQRPRRRQTNSDGIGHSLDLLSR